jgi:hypothetical protein
MVNCAGSFVIGLFAGVCAVFVPRLGGLFAADDLNRISIFPTQFLILGVAYAAIVGAVVAILYYGRTGTPGERFMAALGVPALLAGAMSTSAHTGKVQQLEATRGQLSNAAVVAAQIRKDDTPVELNLIGPVSARAAEPQAGLERLLGIGTAYAQTATAPLGAKSNENWARWRPIESDEPSYAVFVDRATSAEAAQKRAIQLRPKLPNAQAVKSGSGYAVIADIKPESSAVLEAIKIQRELGIKPELMRVK